MAQGSQPNHHVTDSKNYTRTSTTYSKTVGERKKDQSTADKAKKVAAAVVVAAASKNPIVKAGKAIVTATKTASKANKAAADLEQSIATKNSTFKARELESMQRRSDAAKTQKAKDLAEDKKRTAQMARDRDTKPKPATKGPTLGNLSGYNLRGN